MAAGVIADRDLLAGKVLGPGDGRVRRHHDPARRDDVGFAPHRADLLRGGLVHGPVAGAGNVGLGALVATGALVGFERAGEQIGHLAGAVELLRLAGRGTEGEFIVEALVAEIPLLVRDPFLQPAMRLDDEFLHDLSLPGHNAKRRANAHDRLSGI